MNPYFSPDEKNLEIEIRTEAEADEFWSYIGNKGNQRWTWYAIERSSGAILAWHNGRRTDESCSLLMKKLSAFPATCYYTDDWQSCQKIHPVIETHCRKSGHLEDREKKSQFQNAYQTPQPKNNLFFKG